MSKNILIYDVASLPKGKRMLDIKKEFEESNIVMWCSNSFGNTGGKDIPNPPIVLDKKTLGKADNIKFIDTSKEEK